MTTNTDELIKSLPSQWRCIPLKQYFEFGKGLPITKADLVDEGEKVISYGQVHAKYNTGVHVDDQLIRYVSSDYLDTNKSSLCSKGDFIFADTSEDKEGCGNAVYVDTDTPIFAGYHTIILRSDKNNKYLAYLFLSDGWRSQIRRRVQGIKVFSITQKILSQCQIWLPPVSEQQAIADYLDDRCSKIDEIIAEATASIEEYKELKQSVIFEAVTKGLDKNAPMKDSGDNWIGKIPCSWYKCRLSDVSTRIIVGLATSTTPYYRDTGVVMFRNLNIKDGWLDDSELLFLDDEFASKQAGKYINAGDVLTVHTGSNLGLSCVVPDKYDHTLSFTTLITSPDKNMIISEFLAYIINSPLGKREIEKLKVGEIKPNMNVRQFKYFTVIVPPLETQKDIVRYLDNKCELINELISEKQSLIDDLQAYKKSLIYEVVTGKRRVV